MANRPANKFHPTKKRPLRTTKEIEQEYTQVVALYGDFQLKFDLQKEEFLFKLKAIKAEHTLAKAREGEVAATKTESPIIHEAQASL